MPSPASDAILPPPLPRAGRALAATALVWSLAAVVLVTLAPFHFRAPAALQLEWRTAPFDLAVNLALLAVPGFLFRAATGPNRDLYCVGPFAFGLIVSAAIELTQGAVPGRCVSPIDVGANAAGCWFGAMTHDSFRRHVARRVADRLLLDLPLMGLVYLLVPLLWLTGEAAAADGRRLVLAVPLGVMGGGILASVWHHRLRPEGSLSPLKIALVAALFSPPPPPPGLRHRPGMLLVGAAVVTVSTRLLATWPAFLRGDGARFEMPTLRRVGWIYVAYLVVLAGWPWRFDATEWRGAWSAPEIGSPPRIEPLFRLVEHFAAFTVGGYLLAESRGRREEPVARSLLWTLVPFATFAATLEALRGWEPGYGATALRPAVALLGTAFGAVVFRQQLAAVRQVIDARRCAGAAGRPPTGAAPGPGDAAAAVAAADVPAESCEAVRGAGPPREELRAGG